MFCESLAEFLKLNQSIKILDISCNFIDDSNAATLKDSLEGNNNIIEIDVRNNQLSDETVEEIDEIITKNFLASKSIPFKKLGEYAAGTTAQPDASKEDPKAANAKKDEAPAQAENNASPNAPEGGAE